MQNLMPPVTTPDNLFHDGDPTQGIEGTVVMAEWLNNVQGAIRDTQTETLNVLSAADIRPDNTQTNQLLTAINAIVKKMVEAQISTAKYIPAVGDLHLTKNKTNPSTIFPGTTWEYLGAGLTLRTAKTDFSDIGTISGADTVTLVAANMPSHAHTISGTTGSATGSGSVSAVDLGTKTTSSFDHGTKTSSSFDYGTKTSAATDLGTKTTSTTGNHTHSTNMGTVGTGANIGGAYYASAATTVTTSAAGNHSHTVALGSHTHSVSLGAHQHTVAVGAHTHTVALGSHTHSVTMSGHSHSLPASTGVAGSGTAFSVLNRSMTIAVWVRTA